MNFFNLFTTPNPFDLTPSPLIHAIWKSPLGPSPPPPSSYTGPTLPLLLSAFFPLLKTLAIVLFLSIDLHSLRRPLPLTLQSPPPSATFYLAVAITVVASATAPLVVAATYISAIYLQIFFVTSHMHLRHEKMKFLRSFVKISSNGVWGEEVLWGVDESSRRVKFTLQGRRHYSYRNGSSTPSVFRRKKTT